MTPLIPESGLRPVKYNHQALERHPYHEGGNYAAPFNALIIIDKVLLCCEGRIRRRAFFVKAILS
jgi:hypothetical protein